jgi:hypothetical protein
MKSLFKAKFKASTFPVHYLKDYKRISESLKHECMCLQLTSYKQELL